MHRTDDRTDVSLETRVSELERSLGAAQDAAVSARRLTVVLGGALVLAATVAAVGPQRVLDVVQATRLEILDDEGRVVASLVSGERGGQLDLWDDAGRNIFRAAGNRHGADLALWSAQGESVASVYATPHGGRVTVHGSDGTTVARLDAHGGGTLQLADRSGAPQATLRADDAGGELDLGGADGDSTASLRGNATGGSLTLGNDDATTLVAVADPERAVLRIAAADASAGLSVGTGTAVMSADLADGTGVRLRAAGAGPELQLGRGGAAVVQLSGLEGGGELDLSADDGRRATLGASQGLQLLGTSGSTVAALRDDAGRGRLALYDAAGLAAVGIDAGGASRPAAIHLDHGGERIFAIASTPTGGLLNIMNRRGRSVIALGVTDDGPGVDGAGGGGISVLNGEGTVVMTTGVASDRGGHLSVFSPDGMLMRMISPPAPETRSDAPVIR